MTESISIAATSTLPSANACARLAFTSRGSGVTMGRLAGERSALTLEAGCRITLLGDAGRARESSILQGSISKNEVREGLYEDAPCGLLSLDADGEIIQANRTLLSWTGYSAEELSGGKRLVELLTVPGALLYETCCSPLLRTRGSIGEIALDLLCRDGTRLPILLSADARKDASGASTRVEVVILNAPKRREYERDLLVARTQAEDAAEQLRVQRTIAERKMAEQDALLQAMGRMAAGDLATAIAIDPDSELSSLAMGLDRMRQEIMNQLHSMKERNTEILRLNTELRHQIEQRSRHLLDSMQSAMNANAADVADAAGEATPHLLRGTLLANRYRIEAILGRGAMGVVYEVERLSDGRRFAAKVLSARPNHRSMARFAREALLLARLQHANLIGIVDVDITAERMTYLVTDLVHGTSLAELSARYGDSAFMLSVLQQIADALTTVHSAGVVHRDLKPANVLISIDADGVQPTARLADFGISRLLDPNQAPPDTVRPVRVAPVAPASSGLDSRVGRSETLDIITRDDPARLATVSAAIEATAAEEYEATLDVLARPANVDRAVDALLAAPPSGGAEPQSHPADTLTQAGALVGTLLYMAPELLGGASLAQPSSDIFSFGLMAYEVLTGTLPFPEPPLLLAARDPSRLRFEPLDTLCPDLPHELARMLERCLVIDPALRPTADELSRALGTLQITF